jgi:ribose 5-phosphate isomerase B|tara:strand:- start:603 stop:1028 length:426 start_codon:yes stop_codon:yes gene_type:complete
LKKIVIASDHAGYSLKEYVKKFLNRKKIQIKDVGANSNEKVDYPDYAHKLSKVIKKNRNSIGVLICGSGQGMIMAANKHKNIRAALCYNVKSTKLSRLHNDANVITLGSRLISKKNALKCLNIFLKTKFEGGRHKKRIRKI